MIRKILSSLTLRLRWIKSSDLPLPLPILRRFHFGEQLGDDVEGGLAVGLGLDWTLICSRRVADVSTCEVDEHT